MVAVDIEFNSGAQLPMDAIPDLARLAEAHGFECAWGGEANNKDPTVMLAAAAAATRRLKIGSAVYHILGRTPATLALQAAGLDELSSGRFLLGIGVSNATIARWHGTPFDHPLTRVREYLEIVRLGMSGKKLDFNGKCFSSHGFKLAFHPSGRKVPIYLAAFGPKMSRLAGSLTDGVLINMANPEEIGRISDAARAGAKEAGKDPGGVEVIAKVRCSVNENRATARQSLSRLLAYYALADYYRDLLSRMGFAAEVQALRATWQGAGFQAAATSIPDRLFHGVPLIAASSVEEIKEGMRPYMNAGATRIILPYVPSSEEAVTETKRFISSWNFPASSGGSCCAV